MSCSAISKPAFASTTPVNPPTVKRKMKPRANSIGVARTIRPPHMVANHENTLIPVGTAMIMVADVKVGPRVLIQPDVNMCLAHTMNPRIPMDPMA